MADETEIQTETPTEGRAAIGAIAAASAIKKPDNARLAKWVGVGVGVGSAALVAALLYSRQRNRTNEPKS